MPIRFPPPWYIKQTGDQCIAVLDANGFPLAYVYFAGREVVGTNPDRMTKDQARRIAVNIAKLPALLRR